MDPGHSTLQSVYFQVLSLFSFRAQAAHFRRFPKIKMTAQLPSGGRGKKKKPPTSHDAALSAAQSSNRCCQLALPSKQPSCRQKIEEGGEYKPRRDIQQLVKKKMEGLHQLLPVLPRNSLFSEFHTKLLQPPSVSLFPDMLEKSPRAHTGKLQLFGASFLDVKKKSSPRPLGSVLRRRRLLPAPHRKHEKGTL